MISDLLGSYPGFPRSFYKSTVALAANVPELIFGPGDNLNGAVLSVAIITHSNASNDGTFALITKNSAPASWSQGNALMKAYANVGGSSIKVFQLDRELFIPAGFGLWYCAGVAEIVGHRDIGYTLL